MAEPVLSAGQYSISIEGLAGAGSFVYGAGANGIQVNNTQTDTGTLVVQDQSVVGSDGLLFGIDTQPGMVVTQTGQAYLAAQPAAAMDAYSALSGAWNAQAVRFANGKVQILRAKYPGSSVTRRCYGRGRKIMPTYGMAYAGLIPFTAQFQAADNLWYEDAESTLVLTQVPSFAGGLTPPMTPPYQLSAQTSLQSNTLVNTGSQPTWPVLTFRGPTTNPGITFVSTPVSIGYQGSLKTSDTLVIDTRPWVRTALLNGVSVAGNLTGAPMIGLQIQPGSTLVHLAGQDFTGSSQVTISWHNATLAIGGSV
jgi:hypothetical protein